LSAPGRTGANNRIGIGYIGAGRRARQLMDLPEGAQIVAISDLNEARLREVGKDRPWKRYSDYRKMLEASDVDAVIISTPDHWHALNSVHACQSGKDVYCEKPLSLTVHEGRLMVQAARKYQRVFQTGSQQRSMDPCRLGCELIRNGRIGKIHAIHGHCYPSPIDNCDVPAEPVPEGLNWDMWCGQTKPRPFNARLYLPRPHPTGWISFRPYSGGEMTGWGSHGLDLIQWALGTDESGPVEVWPEGAGPKCKVNFRYASGVLVKLDNEGPPGGGLFIGERGKMLVTRDKFEASPAEIAKEPLKKGDVHLYKSNNHLGNWIDCIRSRKKPIADVEIGHRSATMCHLGNIARWTGRRLRWDPAKEVFVGDDKANALLQRPMRKPYNL
jgi:predicted dehydrogenase